MYEISIAEKLNTIGAMEDFLDDQKALQKAAQRVLLAQDIEQYLLSEQPSQEQFESYSDAIIQLLSDNYRLALYLPLEEICLDYAPAKLRAAYHRAWRQCWTDIEPRSNYTQGDIDPKLSTKEGQQIIKALHLLPWLIRNGIVQPLAIDEIIEQFSDNTAAMQALSDCICVFEDKEFFSGKVFGRCSERRIAELSALRPPQPDAMNDEQGEDEADRWAFKRLVMRTHNRARLNYPSGPFSANIPMLLHKVNMIENTMNSDEIILIGGAKLKGYATYSSGLDIYSYDPISKQIVDLRPHATANWQVPNPEAIHTCFNTLWIGIEPQLVRKAQYECARKYFELPEGSQARHDALLAMERDILQSQLMHKGYPYSYNQLSPESSRFYDIDGDSAFYDRRYRSVATCLFAKYIHIPQI